MLTCGLLTHTGRLRGDNAQEFALISLGGITFLPGMYTTVVAYRAWRGHPGFSFDAIPDFEPVRWN